MDQNIQAYLAKQQQQVQGLQPQSPPPLQQPMQGAMGGLGASANLLQGQQNQPFPASYNAMYEKLRGVLMNLHTQGVPGMDKVLNALNQQHVNQMKPQQAVQGASTQQMPNQQPNPMLGIAARAQNVIQNPPQLNLARNIPPIYQQLMANAPQNIENIINTPASSMQSAGRLGQDIRTPGTSPWQYAGDAWGAAQLPLLMASIGGIAKMGATQNAGQLATSNLDNVPNSALQSLMQKVQSGGISSLSPEEKALFDQVPLARWQALDTGVPQNIEKAMTQQAVSPTMGQNIGQVQDDLLRQLGGKSDMGANFNKAIYNALSDQSGGVDFNAKIGQQDLSQLALDKFGEVNPSDAGNFKGFVSPEGKVINVGGGAGLGDHSAISEAFGQKVSDNPFAQNASSYGFMKEASAPRIYRAADEVGVQYVNPLTDAQIKTIGKSLIPDGGTIYWDGPGKGETGMINYSSVSDGLKKLQETLPINSGEVPSAITNQIEQKAMSYLREGQPPLGKISGMDDQVARQRFNIPSLLKIGGGSDRDVYDLGNGNVLKIAKTARGLAQNSLEGDPYAPVPDVIEKGANYAVVQKANPPDVATKALVKQLREAVNYNSRTPAVDAINKVAGDYFAKGDEDTGNMLNDLLNYDVMTNDLTAIRNWGTIDGTPTLVDAGSLNTNIIDQYKGMKNLSDPEFRNIYNLSKVAKKQFGDIDAKTMYGLIGGLLGVSSSKKQQQRSLTTTQPSLNTAFGK